MLALTLLAPLFFIFEIRPFVISERYVGIKPIALVTDSREHGLGEITAFFWSGLLFVYSLWTLSLLTLPLVCFHRVGLLARFIFGFAPRRNCRPQRVFVILTFQGALRLVFLGWLCVVAWRRL